MCHSFHSEGLQSRDGHRHGSGHAAGFHRSDASLTTAILCLANIPWKRWAVAAKKEDCAPYRAISRDEQRIRYGMQPEHGPVVFAAAPGKTIKAKF
jgi:hypothetical protein